MGIRDKVEYFKFYTPLPGMFGVKRYDTELRKLVVQKGIIPIYQHELAKVQHIIHNNQYPTAPQI